MMKRILVIDDDSAVRNLIIETLQFQGWQPVGAADGEEGLRLSREAPDLVLCDIQMPKLDGYQVLKAIRANPLTAALPFVFLTGLAEKPNIRQAMEAGADDYLVKPFTIQELVAAVHARFQKQAVFQENADRKLHELRESLTFALPHELVTPLNSILGFSSLLLDSPNASRDEVCEYASHIRESGLRLRKLVEKFLLYAQVELTAANAEQREAYTHRPAGPTREIVTNSAIRLARENRRESDLDLQIAEAEHPITPGHLDRLVRELLENALVFSEARSRVVLSSGQEGQTFRLEVQDSGRGFSADQIKRVGANLQFDRKLHEQQGTGLGLAIARRIAELYGGSLEIESAPGVRTVVRAILPLPA